MSAVEPIHRTATPVLTVLPTPDKGRRRFARAAVVLAALVVLVVLGVAYPLLARGNELLSARWAEPWALVALVLVPLVFYRAVLGDDRRTPRLRLGTLSALAVGPAGLRAVFRDVPGVARAIGLTLCIGALARPMNTLRPVSTEEEGIDIVLAIDMSGSMRAVLDNVPEDLSAYMQRPRNAGRPTRFDVAKAVVRDFIGRRKTDRIGVVVFGSSAYVVSPPTLDYHLLDVLVSRMDIGLIDPSATVIGDAVGVASARLRRSTAKSKAIILLTDGDNKGGKVAPEYAAKLANVVGARIYSIQIGQGEMAEVQDGLDLFGQPRYVRYAYPVNPKLLKQLATETNGHMYIATDAKALQASFHDMLNRLEKTKMAASSAHFEELYRFLLLPGVLLLALDALLRALVLRRFP